jgi:hypothetical protein
MIQADTPGRTLLRSVTVADLVDRLPADVRSRNETLLASAAS